MSYVDNPAPDLQAKAESAQSIIDQIKTRISSSEVSIPNHDVLDITEWFGGNYKKRTIDSRLLDPSKPIDQVERMIQKCNEVAFKSTTFKDEYIVRGNQALYELLAEIYSLDIAINQSDYREAILKQLKEKLKNRGQKIQSNTPALTILVKYVIGADRKRASDYSRVLAVAKEEKLSVKELADYISRRGGISQIHEIESKHEARQLGAKISKERLDLFREFFAHLFWTSKGSFKYSDPICQHNSNKQNGAETATFCFFMTIYDHVNDVYRIIDGHDFGKTYEDSILRMIIKDLPCDLSIVQKGLNRLKELLMKDPKVPAWKKALLHQELAKSSTT